MKPHQPALPAQIIDQASNWFVAMREPSASSEQHEEFSAWLRASPVHVGAYLDIAKLWGDAMHVDPGFEPAAEEGDDALPENVIPLRAGATPDNARLFDAGRTAANRRPLRRHAVAASIFACTALSGLLYWNVQATPTFSTKTGEQRVIALEDGSIVRLNARSKLKVRMTPESRLIELVDGQALFEVAKNPGRPFIVSSGNVAVRAIGTRFDVYRKSSGIVVTVVEGKVSVSTPETAQTPGKPADASFLSAGEQIIVSRAGRIDQPVKPNVVAATSWTQQELVFDGQPLGAVLDEFNRYSKTPIVLADPSLAQLRVNAVFHTTTPRFVTEVRRTVRRRAGGKIGKRDSYFQALIQHPKSPTSVYIKE